MPPDQNNNWNYGPQYSPAQFAFNNNAEMSQLVSMFSGMIMPRIVGQQNFMPHMFPAQGLVDQYARMQFQNQQLTSSFNVSTDNNADVATRLLAMRSLFTDAPVSDANRAQAQQFAGLLNNPFTKSMAGMLMGPENLEAIMHGRKGDVSALNATVNRIGYYRQDPMGDSRMDAASMADFSRGVYSHLYEEGGDFSAVERDARRGNVESQRQLKKAARMSDQMKLVSDEDFVDTLVADTSDTNKQRIADIYKKHIAGEETDTRKQAEAIVRLDAAAKETGVLKDDEATFGMATNAARHHQVAGVHGFMAGQVSQIAEQMFQRGMLPQSIGALPAADRAKIVGGQEIDDATMTRLAREFGHRELMETDINYRNDATVREKKLNENLSGYKDRLDASLTLMQDISQDPNASSADLDKIEGADLLSGNVDAKRSAAAIKKYTGAIAAVREIFGDSGKSNAPMPALLAALDHLSQGASMQMDPKKIETALRQMQTLAKESGVGFEQLAAMSAQMGSMGEALGVSREATMQNQVAVLAGVKTMRDTGAFSRPMFGAMSQAEATQKMGQNMQLGDASDNARTMAAMASIYAANPNAFIDPNTGQKSEFAEAMEAYNDPSKNGVYEFNGQTKNLFEFAGRNGSRGLSRMAQEAGITRDELAAAFANPATREFMKAGAGYQTQKYEMLRDVGNMAIYGTAANRLKKAAEGAAPGSALAGADTRKMATGVSQVMAEMFLDTADMDQNDQLKHVQENLVDKLQADFKTRLGITDDTQARQLAEDAAATVIGVGDERTRNILRFKNRSEATVDRLSGGRLSMRQMNQMIGQGRDVRTAEEAQRSQYIAQRKAEVGLDFGSHPLARVADYMFEVGRAGGKVNSAEMAKAFFNLIPNEEIREKYTKGMEGGLNALNALSAEKTHTNATIDDLAEKAAAGDKAAEAELRKLGRVNAKKTVISDAELEKQRSQRINDILGDTDKLDKAYSRATGKSLEEVKKLDAKTKQDHLRDLPSFVAEQTNAVLGADNITHAQLTEAARALGAGMAIDPKDQAAVDNINAVRRSYLEGNNADVMRTGIKAALSLVGVDAGAKNADTGKTHAEELQRLITNTDPNDPKAQKALRGYVEKIGITDPAKLKQATEMFETQRVGSALAVDKTLGQSAQTIGTANIDATTVTINADKINQPAGTALPAPEGAAGASGAGPAASGSPGAAAGANAATAAAADAKGAQTGVQAAGGGQAAAAAGDGGVKEITVSGELRLVNAEKVILETVSKNNGAPAPGGQTVQTGQ